MFTASRGLGEQFEELGELGVADDERRGEADAGVVRRVDDQPELERGSATRVRDGLGEADAEEQALPADLGDRAASPIAR